MHLLEDLWLEFYPALKKLWELFKAKFLSEFHALVEIVSHQLIRFTSPLWVLIMSRFKFQRDVNPRTVSLDSTLLDVSHVPFWGRICSCSNKQCNTFHFYCVHTTWPSIVNIWTMAALTRNKFTSHFLFRKMSRRMDVCTSQTPMWYQATRICSTLIYHLRWFCIIR